MDNNDPSRTLVVAVSVVGGVAVVGAIVALIVCLAYCKEKLSGLLGVQSDAGQEPDDRRRSHRHRRRRRRRRRDLVEEGSETQPAAAEVQLENPELAAHRPPPSYDRVHQYSSLEGDLNLVTAIVENGETETRVSMYIGDEDTALSGTTNELEQAEVNDESGQVVAPQQDTLPPTYSTAQLEIAAATAGGEERGEVGVEHETRNAGEGLESISENVAGEGEADERSLPPSYSTAKLELAKRREEVEQTTSTTTNS